MDDEPQNPEAIIEPLREQSARNEEMGFPHPVVHLAAAEAAVREGFAAGRAAERAATDAHGDNLAHWVREWLRFDNDREPPGPNAPYSARLGYESARLNVTEMVSDALAGWEVARSVPSDPKETNDE